MEWNYFLSYGSVNRQNFHKNVFHFEKNKGLIAYLKPQKNLC